MAKITSIKYFDREGVELDIFNPNTTTMVKTEMTMTLKEFQDRFSYLKE